MCRHVFNRLSSLGNPVPGLSRCTRCGYTATERDRYYANMVELCQILAQGPGLATAAGRS
jgi:hypothetical protein